jgi:hypothetical protein
MDELMAGASLLFPDFDLTTRDSNGTRPFIPRLNSGQRTPETMIPISSSPTRNLQIQRQLQTYCHLTLFKMVFSTSRFRTVWKRNWQTGLPSQNLRSAARGKLKETILSTGIEIPRISKYSHCRPRVALNGKELESMVVRLFGVQSRRAGHSELKR